MILINVRLVSCMVLFLCGVSSFRVNVKGHKRSIQSDHVPSDSELEHMLETLNGSTRSINRNSTTTATTTTTLNFVNNTQLPHKNNDNNYSIISQTGINNSTRQQLKNNSTIDNRSITATNVSTVKVPDNYTLHGNSSAKDIKDLKQKSSSSLKSEITLTNNTVANSTINETSNTTQVRSSNTSLATISLSESNNLTTTGTNNATQVSKNTTLAASGKSFLNTSTVMDNATQQHVNASSLNSFLYNLTAANASTTTGGTRSLLNAFLINAMHEKAAVAFQPTTSINDRPMAADLTVSNAGTRSDMNDETDLSIIRDNVNKSVENKTDYIESNRVDNSTTLVNSSDVNNSTTATGMSALVNVTLLRVNTTSPSVNSTTSSVNTTSPSINATTSSVNTTSPSINATTSSVNTTSPSINATTSSVNTTSPSINATILSVNTKSPSINATTSSEKTTSPNSNASLRSHDASSGSVNLSSPSVNSTLSDANPLEGLVTLTFTNTTRINEDNVKLTETKSFMNASYGASDMSPTNDAEMLHIVTLISNLTEGNLTSYPLSMSSQAETITSLARLITSLNGLGNWTEHSNTSSDDSRKLLSAADKSDSLVEHSQKNLGNLNDSLLIRLKDYLRAMNFTSEFNSTIVKNDTAITDRLRLYLDKLKASNVSNKTIARTSGALLDRAKKFPTISNLLEKGKGILEKKLGIDINEKQVAELVTHFINWRDQSGGHPCLKDILNAREINECFATIADCNDGDSKNSTADRRNVLKNLRHFLTCKKRQKTNSVLKGNVTLKAAKEVKSDLENTTTTNFESKTAGRSSDESVSRDAKIKQIEKLMFDEDDCDDSINALEKCKFDKAIEKNMAPPSNLTQEDAIVDHCEELKKRVDTCKEAKRNQTEECDPKSEYSSETCKFKIGFRKFINDTCGHLRDSYIKCTPKQQAIRRSVDANDTCSDVLDNLVSCRNNARRVYEQQDCVGGNLNQTSRCFIMNHLSQTTFSGNIEKADVVKGVKTVDGLRNETLINATTDFLTGNDSFTMKNLTTIKHCEGCMKNNETGPGNNFLAFNDGGNVNMTVKQNKTSEQGDVLGDFLKKHDIDNSINSKCHEQNILEMWQSQDDDDRITVRNECAGVNKRRLIARHGDVSKKSPSTLQNFTTVRQLITKKNHDDGKKSNAVTKLTSIKPITRNLVSEHTTTHKKQTASDGTVTNDKTTEGTKLKDDEGHMVTQKNGAKAAEKVSLTQQKQGDEEEHPHDEKYAQHRKILDDILSGKTEEDNDRAAMEAGNANPIETDQNRTIPIDPSIIKQGEQRTHDPENPDADMGMMGIDEHPAIEEPEEKSDKERNGTSEKPEEVNDSNDDEIRLMKSKSKEDEKYWLGADEENNNKKVSGKSTSSELGKKKHDVKRILCFGDSITKGFLSNGKRYHPFSIKLEALLREDGKNVEIVNHGMNGHCVSLEMEKRLAKDLEELPKLDLVIILGGTNDLLGLDCVRKLDLFKEIKNLHDLVKAKEYKSVIVTIPESKLPKTGPVAMTLLEYRRELDDTNKKLRMFALAAKLPIIDLAEDFARYSVGGKNVSGMWDDDIHPSHRGYDRIGELIYDKVKNII